MKKLLVTGGVLFAVMPAMALDLPTNLIEGGDSVSCSSTQDPEFANSHDSEHPLQMQALYVTNTCSAGQYLSVTGSEPTIDNNGILTNATCTTCPAGSYCEGISDITITNNQLESSYGMTQCNPGYVTTTTGQSSCSACTGATYSNANRDQCSAVQTGYYANAEHSGETQCPEGYRDAAGVETINSCAQTCSLNDLNYGTDYVSAYTLVANTATYNSDPTLQQFCEKRIDSTAANQGCSAGYERKAVASIIGDKMPTAPGAYSTGTQDGHTTWTAILDDLTVGGVAYCKTSQVDGTKIGCFMRATSLNGHAINGTTLEATQYQTQSACESGCAKLSDQAVGNFFIDQSTSDGNRFAKMVGDRYLCTPSEVTISWGDVDDPDGAETCTYGTSFTAPAAPAAEEHPGYKFLGWKVTSTNNNNND